MWLEPPGEPVSGPERSAQGHAGDHRPARKAEPGSFVGLAIFAAFRELLVRECATKKAAFPELTSVNAATMDPV